LLSAADRIVDAWEIWAGLAVLGALMVLSTLNLALRMPSRIRLEEQFSRLRREHELETFVEIRPQYMLGTAALRVACTLSVLLLALRHAGVFDATGPGRKLSLTLAVTFVAILVFAVAVPYAWAKYTGEWLIVQLLPVLRVIRIVTYPLIVVLEKFDPFVRRLAQVPAKDARSYADEMEQEILKVVSEGERHGAVDEEEKEMIESVIELTDKRVDEIMTPRTDVVAVEKASTLEDAIDLIHTKGHSRIPVYDGTIDTILGVLYAKDLLRRPAEAPVNLTSMMREAYFIPESKLVRDLLREFQARKVHIAIVLDEYGGTAGLITIEDIVEELVGEIIDEYDTGRPAALTRIDSNTVEVDARMDIDALNHELNLALPEDEDYETIGGLVFSALGRIPKVGERCTHDNLGIQVIAADPRRILRLRLSITPKVDEPRLLPEKSS